MLKRNLLKAMKAVILTTLVPSLLFSMTQAKVFALNTGVVAATGITGTVIHTTPGSLEVGAFEINTLQLVNVVKKTGNITINFNDGDINGVSTVPVVAGETAEQVAAKILKYYDNPIMAPAYKVTASGVSLLFTAAVAAADKNVKVSVIDKDSTGVGALSSIQIKAGMAATSTKQVDTLIVGNVGGIAGNILVTFNDGIPVAKTVGVTTGDTATQVATKISTAFSGLTGYEVTASGSNVAFTSTVAAANKNVAITIADTVATTGVTGTVINTTSGSLVAGVLEVNTLQLVNDVKKTGNITINFNDGDINGISTVPVVAGETAAQVATKILKYYDNPIMTPAYKVTASGTNVIFSAVAAAADKAVKVTVSDFASTGVGTVTSVQTTAGVAETSTKQVDTLIIGSAGTVAGNILVTFNDGISIAKTVGVTTGDTATQVASKIGTAFSGLAGYEVTASGSNVLFTSAVAAENKTVKVTIVYTSLAAPNTGVTGTLVNTTPASLVAGTLEVNTLKLLNVVKKTGKIMINFNDGVVRGTSIVPVVAGETAAQVAAKIPKYYDNFMMTPYYKVTASGANVIFTAVAASADKNVQVTVEDSALTGVGTLSSTQTAAGVATKGIAQVDTLTVTAAKVTGNILVTFNDGTSIAKTIAVTAGDTATQVATKISTAFSALTGYKVVASGANVVFTSSVIGSTKPVTVTIVNN